MRVRAQRATAQRLLSVNSHTWLKVLIVLTGVFGAMNPVQAATVIDQQQPTIDGQPLSVRDGATKSTSTCSSCAH